MSSLFKHTLVVVFFSITAINALGQNLKNEVKGALQDSTGEQIIAATVKLYNGQDTLYAISDADGAFTFNNVKFNRFGLSITTIGFKKKTLSKTFSPNQQVLDLGVIRLETSSQVLREVSIDGTPLITVKEDTLEYQAKDYTVREGDVTEELLKKMDGIEVDPDGNITAQGEEIQRVRINGKDFFGGDVKTATKNLPADVIEKIQIIDDYGEMANLTGNRTGDAEKVLNIEIAPEKNTGTFGNIAFGGGTEDRYQALGMYNYYMGDRQLSVLANLNNTNANLFDFGITGGGSRRGRGNRGGGGGGNRNGLTNSTSVGFNYRDAFLNEKLTTYGSYSYSHNNNNTLSEAYNQYWYPGEEVLNTKNTDNESVDFDHRLEWEFEYKPDDVNFFRLSPSFSYSSKDRTGFESAQYNLNSAIQNSSITNNTNSSTAPNLGISGLFNHRFNDKGRNLFVNFSLRNSASEEDREEIVNTLVYTGEDLDSTYRHQIIDLNNKRWNGGVSLSYTEPLGEFSRVELRYNYDFANYDNKRQVDSLLEDGTSLPNIAQSNIYDYSFITHEVSLSYRYRTETINYSIGASAEPNILKANTIINGQPVDIQRKGINFAPLARFEYKFSRTKRLSFAYNGRSNEPGFSQLQPITNSANPQYPVTGNPNLDAEFSHNVRLRYSNFNRESGNSLFASIRGSMTNDKIVTNRTSSTDPELGLIQSTTYLNTDGFFNVQGNYYYSKPIADRKYVFSINGRATFNNNISFTDSQKNTARNWVLSQGLRVQINPKEWLEITPGLRYSYNTTRNSTNDRGNTNISTWSYNFRSKIYFTPTLFWSTDLRKMTNRGYSQSLRANPFIINTYVEKQFFKGKQGSIRLSAFDLLDEGTSISRTVTENSSLDSRSNQLSRYFMLGIAYRFQKFAGGSGGAPPEMNRRGGRMRGRF